MFPGSDSVRKTSRRTGLIVCTMIAASCATFFDSAALTETFVFLGEFSDPSVSTYKKTNASPVTRVPKTVICVFV
jgi:hypothetical protein